VSGHGRADEAVPGRGHVQGLRGVGEDDGPRRRGGRGWGRGGRDGGQGSGITPRPTAGTGASLSDARGDPSTPSPSDATPSPSDANTVFPSTRTPLAGDGGRAIQRPMRTRRPMSSPTPRRPMISSSSSSSSSSEGSAASQFLGGIAQHGVALLEPSVDNGGGAIQSSSPTQLTTNDLSSSSVLEGSAASFFYGGIAQHGAASSEPQAAAPSGSTPNASQFASMAHSKEWGRDDYPASIVEEQPGTAAIHPTAESFRPAAVEDNAIDGPDVDPSSFAPGPVVGGDTTNWANTRLDHFPPSASLTCKTTLPLPTFMPTSSPVRITNFAEAFREPSSSSANHADGGAHGENAFEDDTDVLSVDNLMMREADGTSPHLTESYATASYVANVEDGPHTQTTFRSRDPPHPLMATRMNWSLRAQSVQMTSSCVPMARSYQRQSMTDATLHHVRTEPIPATGIYFPVWGSGGNIVCV